MKKMYKVLYFVLIFVLVFTQGIYAQTSTYNSIGAVQTYTVPVGVTSISVDAWGAAGGHEGPLIYVGTTTPGKGGRTQATLAVTPGEVLNLYVGGIGPDGASAGVVGGYNGGGGAALYTVTVSAISISGGGGGGATDIRVGGTLLSNRVIIAAGGGGAGNNGTCTTGGGDQPGGDGGGLYGDTVTTCDAAIFALGFTGITHAAGATSTTGGVGGALVGGAYTPGTAGTLGNGGSNVAGGGVGGGGGGGLYGGGGGCWTGGAGGSSYSSPTATTGAAYTTGYNTGAGKIIICAATPGTITGFDTVCAGATTPFVDATGAGGGLWTSGSPSTATVGLSSGIVTGVAAGVAVITYTVVTPGCGSAYATKTVTVDASPVPIVGSTGLCLGTSSSLSDATPSGVWSMSNPTVATVSVTGTIHGTAIGVDTVYYTYAGCSSHAVVLVSAAPGPVVVPDTFCMGTTAIALDSATGGSWTSTNPAAATIGSASGLITPVAPGLTTIIYANACGPSHTASILINPLPAPIGGVPSACIGLTTHLSDSTFGGIWSSNSTTVATIGSTGVVTGASAGSEIISYTLPTGCYVTTIVSILPPISAFTGGSVLCAGTSTTLTISPAGGVWSSSDSAILSVSSGVVTGVSMGTAKITYSLGSGCFSTHSMTVNPMAPILGHDSVCVGGTTYLTNIVGGGIWESLHPPVASITSDSGHITGWMAGITTITYTLPTGCRSYATFQVIDYPSPITGVKQACPGTPTGTTTLLSSSPSGGIWTSGDVSVATVDTNSGMVTGVAASLVNITYTVLPGCIVYTQVTINPLPAAITAASETVCPGVIDTLFDPTPGGTWTSTTPGQATVVDSSGIVTTIVGPLATFKYTLPTGCAVSHSIAIDPTPPVTVTYNPGTMTLYATTGYAAYQWYDDYVGKLIGATSSSVAGLYPEHYYVIVTDSIGCKGKSALFDLGYIMGVSNVAGNDPVKMYPNPASTTVYIESAINVRAVVSGIDGKMQMEVANAKEIDLSKLAPGMYFVGLYNDSGNLVALKKLVKE